MFLESLRGTMAHVPAGGLLSSLRSTFRLLTVNNVPPALFLQTREYAARKGTREKALKKKQARVREKLSEKARMKQRQKVKVVEQNITIAPVKISNNEHLKPAPAHKIWIGKFHPWKIYSFEEAIMSHRQTHHPTMYDLPDADVDMFLELKEKTKKKMSNQLPKVFYVPHTFVENTDKNIVAFIKNAQSLPPKLTENILCGGRELVKEFEDGTYKIKDFDYILAETAILSEILVIRGLLKKKFPNVKSGTLGNDMEKVIGKFKYGVSCLTQSYADKQAQYMLAKICIGRLDMDVNHLEENLSAILNEIQNSIKQKYDISRVRILCAPSTENFKIDISKYVSESDKLQKQVEKDAEEEDVEQAVIDVV